MKFITGTETSALCRIMSNSPGDSQGYTGRTDCQTESALGRQTAYCLKKNHISLRNQLKSTTDIIAASHLLRVLTQMHPWCGRHAQVPAHFPNEFCVCFIAGYTGCWIIKHSRSFMSFDQVRYNYFNNFRAEVHYSSCYLYIFSEKLVQQNEVSCHGHRASCGQNRTWFLSASIVELSLWSFTLSTLN